MGRKYRVGILGATGTVGQRFIQMLEGHPQFEVAALAASDRSKGKRYSEACAWRLAGDMPEGARSLELLPLEPPFDCDVVFSSLPGEMARETEEAFARAGHAVISNSSALRMDEDVPLLIPEVNHEHLSLLDAQKSSRSFERGMIVTNPNCSTIMIALALAPLHARFGIESGYGETPEAVGKSISEILRTGVVGFNLEDGTPRPDTPVRSIEDASARRARQRQPRACRRSSTRGPTSI